MSEISVRHLLPADAALFHELRLEALATSPEAFGASAEDWGSQSLARIEGRLREIEAAGDFVLAAFDAARAVGMMGFLRGRHAKLRHKGTVWGVYVRPQWRGRGVAGRLLDELIRRSRGLGGLEQLQLQVVTVNRRAQGLYESRGFRSFGVEARAIKHGDRHYDQLHMQLFLDASSGK